VQIKKFFTNQTFLLKARELKEVNGLPNVGQTASHTIGLAQ